jgi:hypothetical protein
VIMKWFLAVSAILSTPASAVTVSISATNLVNFGYGPGGDTLITDAAGLPLGQGRIHIGTFVAGFNPRAAAHTSDIAALLANFRAVVGGPILTPPDWSAVVGMDDVTLKGFYNADANAITWPDEQLDQDIYLFIGNGVTLADSTQLGLVRHFARITSSSPIGFELSDPLEDFSSSNHFTGGLFLNVHPYSGTFTGEIVMGSKGHYDMTDPFFWSYNGEMDTLQLVAIPEAGSLTYLMPLACVLMRRRRE